MSGRWQWRLLWLGHSKFIVGVTGIVRDEAGRVLLLRHRFWSEGREWGLPTGYAKSEETFQNTIIREVAEEVALEVRVTSAHPLRLRSGYRLRVEIVYEADLVGGTLAPDGFEVEQAGWFAIEDLPIGLHPDHRDLIAGLTRTGPNPP